MDADEIKARLDLTDVIERYIGHPARHAGRWTWWHCPFHRDVKKPSFGVTNDNGLWKCYGCGASGDHFTFVMLHQKVGFKQALDELGKLAGVAPAGAKKTRTLVQTSKSGLPSVKWQEACSAFVADVQRFLWSVRGDKHRAYLHGRKLNDDTISHWNLGWNPCSRYDKPGAWGLERDKDVWIPAGLVIPGQVGNTLWYVKIRTECGDPKYYKLPIPDGASSVALLGSDQFVGGRPLVLVEKEIDFFLVWQDARDLVDAGTFGGASNGHNPRAVNPMGRWMGCVMGYETILLSYDDDDAGNQAIKDFQEISAARMKRIFTPHGKDIGEFAERGGNVRAWIASELGLKADRPRSNNGYPLKMIFLPGPGLAAPAGRWRELHDGRIEMTFNSRAELEAMLWVVKAIGTYPGLEGTRKG